MSDDRSTAEIEREIEEERHALARSLEDLQQTLSPERLINQATGYMRENGGEFADRLVAQVKANPLAATMAGIGVAWLLASSTRRPVAGTYDRNRSTHDMRYAGINRDPSERSPALAYDDRTYPAAPGSLSRAPYSGGYDARLQAAAGGYEGSDDPSMLDRAKDAAGDAVDGVKDAAASAASSARAGWERTKDGASDAWQGTRDGAAGTWDDARHGASDAWGSTRDGAAAGYGVARDGAASAYGGAAGVARDGYDGARNGWSDMQGAAADRWGAATGATSRAWQEWQGGARARMDGAKYRLRDAQGRLYARSSDLRTRLADGTEGMTEQARIRVMRARQAAADMQSEMEARFGEATASGRRMYDEQPLVGGLIAAGIGAALGALLPRTEVEDEYIGAYRDRAFDEADAVFREEASKLRAVADAALDEAKAVADEKLEGVKGAIGDAKAATPTGEEAVSKAEAEAKSAAQRIADAAKSEAEKQNLGAGVRAEAAKAESAAKDAASKAS